jgi:hypothetical protein
VGENLYATSSSDSHVEGAAISGWYSEMTLYDFKKPGLTPAAAEFTQMIWNSTTSLGCAMASCPELVPGWEMSLVVCHYAPPGNINDAFEANVFPPVALWK